MIGDFYFRGRIYTFCRSQVAINFMWYPCIVVNLGIRRVGGKSQSRENK